MIATALSVRLQSIARSPEPVAVEVKAVSATADDLSCAVAALTSKDVQERRETVCTLARLAGLAEYRKPALAALEGALRHEDQVVVSMAKYALGGLPRG